MIEKHHSYFSRKVGIDYTCAYVQHVFNCQTRSWRNATINSLRESKGASSSHKGTSLCRNRDFFHSSLNLSPQIQASAEWEEWRNHS